MIAASSVNCVQSDWVHSSPQSTPVVKIWGSERVDIKLNINGDKVSHIVMHQRDTRSSSKLHVKTARTAVRQRALSIAAPLYWNSLPENIKLSSSVHRFK